VVSGIADGKLTNAMGQMAQQPVPQQPFNIDLGRIFAANKPAGSKALLQALAAERKASVTSLVLVDLWPVNPMLAGDVAMQLESLVLETGKVPKFDLFLRSTGGMAEIPWRMVSLIRSFSDEFEVIVPRLAMSGATHIAIAADNIVMSPLSCLGSVDPTRSHQLLPRDPTNNMPIPVSVQDLKHCLQFVKSNVPENEAVGPIVSELFKHVSPLAIGALEQSYELSRLITRKVLASRKKKIDPKDVEKIVDQLAGKYFSHGYFISRAEVESDLGLEVVNANPGDELFNKIEALNSYYTGVFQKEVPVPGAPVPLTFRITGFLETPKSRRILCQVMAQGPNGPNTQVVAGTWITENNS
jgi:hypothetical protein